MSKYVITIGRQFGSGGREIAKGLAHKLGIPFYDKDILDKIAEERGLPKDLLEAMDETLTGNLRHRIGYGLHSLAMMYGTPVDYSTHDDAIMTNDRIFNWKAKLIRELAEEGPCVIVGRCADYILRDEPGLISVFISAPMADREARIMKLHPELHDNAPAALIRQTDKARASYYNYHTDRNWGDIDNYHLCVDATRLGKEGTIDFLAEYVTHCAK
ncbi:MAG: cytidylate kinase-like family protein [Oscillospiraceae bacterium]|nr:cytidylate kinase-like family protein [Oscillospiraceae bacterium]